MGGGRFDEEQDIFMIVKCLLPNFLLVSRGEKWQLLSGVIKQHLVQVVKISITDERQVATLRLHTGCPEDTASLCPALPGSP